MHQATKQRRRTKGGAGLAAGSALLSAILLSGCSSMPQAMNPVHWYDSVAGWVSGPDEEAPTQAASPGERAPAKGLSADRANAKYSEAVASREGTPTRPLNPDVAVAHAAAPAAVAASGAVAAPAPVAVATTDAAPPPPVSQLPPQRAAAAGPEAVDDVYRRRLAEFDSAPVQPAATFQPSSYRQASSYAGSAPLALGPSASTVAYSANQPIQLVRPGRTKTAAKGERNNAGYHSLSEFDDSRSSASFDLAAMRFGEGTSELSSAELAHLKDVAGLYRQKGGSLRIIGRSTSPRLDVDPAANQDANRALARARADAVAAELVRLGVPARKIYAGADPQPAQLAMGDATDIVLDY